MADSLVDHSADVEESIGVKDEWQFAIRYRDLQRFGHLEPKKKQEVKAAAIRAIRERAHEMLGPVRRPQKVLSATETEVPWLESAGASVELDIESTLDSELRFQARLEQHHGVILLLDTSLSMKGEKLALLGVTVAAVHAVIPDEYLCILGFDSEIHVVKEFTEKTSVDILIERVLSIPPGGFTNIDLGLQAALSRMGSRHVQNARVIVVSDGRYTEGLDPVIKSKQIPFLYPVRLGRDPGGFRIMREMASQGRGQVLDVKNMLDLPKKLLNAIRVWVR